MFLTTEVGLYWYAGKPLGFYTKLIVGSVNRKEIQKNERRLLPEVPVSSLESSVRIPWVCCHSEIWIECLQGVGI